VYRIRIIVNGCYWNTYKLVFTINEYPNSYSYQCERRLTLSSDVKRGQNLAVEAEAEAEARAMRPRSRPISGG